MRFAAPHLEWLSISCICTYISSWMMYRLEELRFPDPKINPWNPPVREMDGLTVAWVDVPFPLGPLPGV